MSAELPGRHRVSSRLIRMLIDSIVRHLPEEADHA